MALNEVGSDPGGWGMTVEAFHAANASALARWPAGMLTTSTHDTKRSEDVRARLLVLAEMPAEWAETVERWRAMLVGLRTDDGPDPATEYLV